MEIVAQLEQLQPVVEREKFKSRKVWVTTEWDGKYPQTIEVELQQDKVDLLNDTPVGSEIKLYINLRGRKWTKPETQVTSVFNSLVAWKVDILKTGLGTTAAPAAENNPNIEPLPF